MVIWSRSIYSCFLVRFYKLKPAYSCVLLQTSCSRHNILELVKFQVFLIFCNISGHGHRSKTEKVSWRVHRIATTNGNSYKCYCPILLHWDAHEALPSQIGEPLVAGPSQMVQNMLIHRWKELLIEDQLHSFPVLWNCLLELFWQNSRIKKLIGQLHQLKEQTKEIWFYYKFRLELEDVERKTRDRSVILVYTLDFD